MSGINSFSAGYDNVNEAAAERSSWRRRTRKRIAIITFSSVLLAIIVVAAVVGTKASRSKKEDKSVASATPTSVIKMTCSVVPYTETCVQSFSNLTDPDHATPEQLFTLTLQIAMNDLVGIAGIPGQLAARVNDTMLKQALTNCQTFIDDSIYYVNSSISAVNTIHGGKLNESKVEDLRTLLSAVLTNFDTCLDGLENTTVGFREVIQKAITNSTKLTSNSLAIVTKVLGLLSKYDIGGGLRRRLLYTTAVEVLDDGFPAWLSPADRRLLHSKQKPKPKKKSKKPAKKPKKTTKEPEKKPTKPSTPPPPPPTKPSTPPPPPTKPSTPPPPPTKPTTTTKPTESGIKADVVVAKDGSGDVKTVAAAIAKAKDVNTGGRFIIYVKKGVYAETVIVDKKLPNIMLVGDGMDATTITGSLNSVDGVQTYNSATFAVEGPGFIAKDIGFANTAGAAKHQAVALRVNGDKAVFYRCKFDGFQDTLYVYTMRQFFSQCTILGTIDFIFGNSAAVFQNCAIVVKQPMAGQSNTVTAQGKTDPNQNTGISIHMSAINPASSQVTAKTYLGRPWKDYATTVIMKTNIGKVVDPAGWLPWTGNTAPDTIFYAEYQNTGSGSSTSGRVKWKGYNPSLPASTAAKYAPGQFISGDEWISGSGAQYQSGL
ncbi:putative pectinesterase/pectinesterase inhibitor 46 [Nymphaea thermarum]|nr:putative pectinesterase/pectinesterase inhibitor 46 [Nymphaea thermarum]